MVPERALHTRTQGCEADSRTIKAQRAIGAGLDSRHGDIDTVFYIHINKGPPEGLRETSQRNVRRVLEGFEPLRPTRWSMFNGNFCSQM